MHLHFTHSQRRLTIRIFAVLVLYLTMGLQLLNANVISTPIDIVTLQLASEQQLLIMPLKLIKDQNNMMFFFPSQLTAKNNSLDLTRRSECVPELFTTASVSENAVNFERFKENRTPTSLNNGKIQSQIVTGNVTDAGSKTPLAGVSVLIKGTADGTTTDANGAFSISVQNTDVLIFSFIGFTTVAVPVVNRTTIDVSLVETAEALKEVVINAGYYEVTDRTKTSNIGKVSADAISKQPLNNIMGGLQGRLAGVYVQQPSGVPGGGFKVEIRGRNSLRLNGNDPLYIVDGVPYTSTSINQVLGALTDGVNPLNFINPADVESIEILKDADATSIYGSRGANGVVLITTKKGKPGQVKVDVNMYIGFGTVSRKMELLNTQQYLELRREAYRNDGTTPAGNAARDLLRWDTTRYTDWQDELLGGTARMSNAQISLSGGANNTQFMVGVGYFKETTVFPGDFDNRRVSSHFTLNHVSDNNKLRIQFKGEYTEAKNTLPADDLTAIALSLPPIAPSVYNDDGSLNWQSSTWTNPLRNTQITYINNSNNFLANLVLSYELIRGLTVKLNGGVTNATSGDLQLAPTTATDPAFSPTGNSVQGNGSLKTWIIEPQLEFRKKIDESNVSFLIGSTFQENINAISSVMGYGYTSNASLRNLLAAPQIYVLASDETQYKYQAWFARVNYNFKDKYFINGTFRRDGSSRFGPDKRYANFGAVGAGWIFSDESFFEAVYPVVSYGKMRASYGTTGSDRIPDYGYMDTYSNTMYTYDGVPGLIPTRLVNPDYAWELNKKFEVALELGFLRDRIFLNTSWYQNRSSNQLVGYDLSVVTGQPSVQYNLPATVQNTGLEIELNTSNVNRGIVSWSTAFNLTIPRNKLIEYPNIDASSYASSYVVGRSLNIRKVYNFLGVDPTTGVYQYEDVDGDGQITADKDRNTIVEVGQKFYGGFQNVLRVGNIELDFLFQFVNQRGDNVFSAGNLATAPGRINNQPVQVLDRWRNEGDRTDIQKFTASGNSAASVAYSNGKNFGEQSISDASFVRLKNVSLSYNLPTSLRDRLKLSSCRFYTQCQNVFTITNYNGFDPENMNIKLPSLRVFTVGIQAAF
ncbi:SusC/RagA family TonB-linked outer membrane protein [Fulvivirgaceae bacterium PWU5]|uniref:SusC/RagA family TonB-linked outer membrane protein n=1 Tax=Dawidia cretensis TaxID=2782350 RepID=A0AAP2E4A9_9BACT|nr:SusC/RagA family TonB-linked outer membrane protein [Dawidia cretensis]MBT1711933.1 SusC/RagA family TonB-linked outer membrane protein [Dawidia cretensis]